MIGRSLKSHTLPRQIRTTAPPRRSSAAPNFAPLVAHAAHLVTTKNWFVALRDGSNLPSVKTVNLPHGQLVIFHADMMTFSGFTQTYDDRRTGINLRPALLARVAPSFAPLMEEILRESSKVRPTITPVLDTIYTQNAAKQFETVGIVGGLYFSDRRIDSVTGPAISAAIGRYAYERLSPQAHQDLRTALLQALGHVYGPQMTVDQHPIEFNDVSGYYLHTAIPAVDVQTMQVLAFRATAATETATFEVLNKYRALGVPVIPPRASAVVRHSGELTQSIYACCYTESGPSGEELLARWKSIWF